MASHWRDQGRFYSEKLHQLRHRRITPSLTEHSQVLADLRNDGIAFIGNFMSAEEINRIKLEIETRSDLFSTRTGEGTVKRNGRYLLLDPALRVPSTSVFFDSPVVSGLARAYLSPVAVPDRPAVQYKVDVNEPSVVELFHIDEWRYLISVFLLLSDVGPEQAPLVYLKGSHKPRRWRIAKEQDFFFFQYSRDSSGTEMNEETPYCGCFLPTDVRRIQQLYGYEQISCEAPAGTLIIFDNLGLHRASRLIEGHRLLLSSYWILPR